MHHVRVFGVGLAIFVFTPLAGLVTYSFALNRTVTHPGYIKENLRTSGVYSALGFQVQNSFMQDSEGNEVPAPVQKAVAATITPLAIQSLTEPVLDKAFNDMDDPAALTATTINLAPIKNEFKQALHTESLAYLKSLPACSQRDIPNQASLLSLKCRPPGIDVRVSAAAATKQVMDDPSIPKDSIALGNVLGENNNAGAFVLQVSEILRWTRLSVYICSVLFLLTAVSIVVLSSTLRGGIHRLTTLLLTTAIIFALTSGLTAFALQRTNFGGAETLTIESALGSSMRLLGLEIFKLSLYFAAGFGIVGVILLIGLYATEKKKPRPVEHNNSATIHS